jgi:hypothetical protein
VEQLPTVAVLIENGLGGPMFAVADGAVHSPAAIVRIPVKTHHGNPEMDSGSRDAFYKLQITAGADQSPKSSSS